MPDDELSNCNYSFFFIYGFIENRGTFRARCKLLRLDISIVSEMRKVALIFLSITYFGFSIDLSTT